MFTHSLRVGQEVSNAEGEPTREWTGGDTHPLIAIALCHWTQGSWSWRRRKWKRRLTTGPDKRRTREGVPPVGKSLGQLQQRLGSWKQAPSLCWKVAVWGWKLHKVVHWKSCIGLIKKLGYQKKVFWMSLEKVDDWKSFKTGGRNQLCSFRGCEVSTL